ncbi:MAG: NAD(P)H-hydrate dehydratase [Bacteroidia bacterium]|nr:NAD(P)H-hydrate dehydratase [Bacteroidia bacterium]
MKFFTTSQIAELDRYTIENEPIEAIDLMERASLQLADWISTRFDTTQRIAVFAGPGNNGGDALAVSRMLTAKNFKVGVFIPDSGRNFTDSFLINLDRLRGCAEVTTINWNNNELLPELIDYNLIIDGLFGSGLSRPLSGFPAELVKHLNHSGVPIIAIDIPSGLMGEDNQGNDPDAIIQASYTLTFQFPKLSFFFKENERFTGKWEVLPIGLHPTGIEQTQTPWHYSDIKTMVSMLKPRGKFSHKGTYGHALLVAGSHGKMGAAVLAAKGCLRSGVGLLSVQIPFEEIPIMQIAVPEAMVEIGYISDTENENRLKSKFKSIGIGPGRGTNTGTVNDLNTLMKINSIPLVIDADALNVLSENPKMVQLLPEDSILTPHPLEFERLAGYTISDFERLKLALNFAKEHRIILILKGAYTAIALPDGNCWFNSTGNPGMATGGSGDVLTGILTGLLAQGYTPQETALLGVYLHGLSGDLCLSGSSEESLLAGDIADHLGKAFAFLKSDPDFGKAKKKSQF